MRCISSVCLLSFTITLLTRLQRETRISTSPEKFRQEEGEIRGQLSGMRKYLRDAIIESFPRHGGADARGGSLFPIRLLTTVISCVCTTRNMLNALQIASWYDVRFTRGNEQTNETHVNFLDRSSHARNATHRDRHVTRDRYQRLRTHRETRVEFKERKSLLLLNELPTTRVRNQSNDDATSESKVGFAIVAKIIPRFVLTLIGVTVEILMMFQSKQIFK